MLSRATPPIFASKFIARDKIARVRGWLGNFSVYTSSRAFSRIKARVSTQFFGRGKAALIVLRFIHTRR